MRPFDFVRARDAGEALAAALGTPEARFIAGGTALLDLMKQEVERPDLLIDINGLDLAEVTSDGKVLSIGALARMHDVARHPAVQEDYPVIAEALLASAAPQLRHMGTVGGNLLQRTRCPYFRDPAFPCNKRDPGSGCPAIHGVNRRHAVLGTSDACIAAHPSDLAVALVACDAVLRLAGEKRARRVPLRDFYRLPGKTPHIETGIGHGELIVAVEIPHTVNARRSAYVKVRDRAAFDFALASAAVVLDVEDARIREARIGLGGVATVPWRADEAEAALRGARPGRGAYGKAARLALAGARPRGQNAYKVALARNTLVRALETAAGSA